jgi:UDP-N-acetylglucosamine:LPS N-acetylglucosamine transferase
VRCNDRKSMIVDLIYMDAGGGHRASAQALQASLALQHPDWTVRLSNLFGLLDPQGQFRKFTGMGPEDYYNKRLAKGWTLGLTQELKLLQFSIGMLHDWLLTTLGSHWRRARPDLVVSLIPNFNRVLFESLKQNLPAVPYVTIMTDLADYPPNFWIEPNQEQYFICGTAKAAEQAIATGHSPERVYRTSGMILHPNFYRTNLPDRAAERRKLNLDPDWPTGLVIFGGHGSSKMRQVARSLSDTQLILICGRNHSLAAKLRNMSSAAPRLVVDFTTEVSYYMSLADFCVGKPGPGSISEAVAMRLPVIVESNAWTMPQEIYNATWITEQDVGVVIKSLRNVGAAVRQLTEHLPRYQASVAAIKNRAVYEIPAILQKIATCSADAARVDVAVRGHTNRRLRSVGSQNAIAQI